MLINAGTGSGIRVSVVFAALFWVMCISLVYLPEWLRRTGLDTAQVGLVLACATWLKVPLTLFAGHTADRIGRRKRVMVLLATIVVLCFPLLFVVRGYYGLCVLWAILGALASTMVPLTDSISVTGVRREQLTYGRMRMWGSVSFLIASVIGGVIIRHFGDNAVVWLLCGGAVVLWLSVLQMPDYKTRQPPRSDNTLFRVFKVPGFITFLLVSATLMASHAALYSLSTVHWLAEGIELPVIGMLWATGVIAEVVIFYLSAKVIARFDPWKLLAIAGAVGLVRWSLTAVVADAGALFIIQTLHAITFTFTQLAVVNYIAREIPEDMTSSAQTIYDSCAIGLIFGLALYVSGLLSRTEIAYSFWAMAVMSGAGGGVACLVCLLRRSNSASLVIEKNNGERTDSRIN